MKARLLMPEERDRLGPATMVVKVRGNVKKLRPFALLFLLCLIGAASVFRAVDFRKFVSLVSPRVSESAYLTVEKAPFTAEVPAFGELQTASATSISVPRLQTGGLKVFRIVKNGSWVRTGDILVAFDATELIRQAEETQNSLEAALRQLEVTVLQGSREKGQMMADREIASMELEKAKTQAPKDATFFSRNEIIDGNLDVDFSTTKLRELGGKLDSSNKINSTSQKILIIEQNQHKDRLGILRQSLGSLQILAPHEGLVLHVASDPEKNREINVGDTCWPGQVILTIPDFSKIEARVFLLESDAGGLRVGQSAYVSVDSHPNVLFEATLKSIDLRARQLQKNSPVKYCEARLEVRGESGDVLKPGKAVHARITVAKMKDVITVPRNAVVEEGPRFFVWVGSQNGPERREVQVAPGDIARIVLRSGVSAGESVLLNPPRTQTTPKGDLHPKAPLDGRAARRK